ncbi:MAG: suppressor of fused domain protein [Oscillospiraceae bacterium]|nr:suppressor of fused domain protein [Oscillospiraceae bacterium]
MRIDKQELLKQLKEWSDSGENAKIVSAARLLPINELDDEALTILADAYIEEKSFKNAIGILESQRQRLDGDYHWHFRMGMALYLVSCGRECEDDEDLKRDILERAQVSFARCMNLNPPENVLEEAGNFMDRIDDEYNRLFDEDDDYDSSVCEVYDEEELDAIEEHIEEYFGDFPTIFHEIKSPDIHCDIYIVPPTENRDYYTLITVGMGAHIMDIPEGLDAEELGRAELMVCLPKSWKIGESSPEWFWPISLLKNMARFPINCETWLGWGHSIDNKDAFAANTSLCGALLIYPEDVESGADCCRLPNGDTVNFLELIPLYREEMDFKIDNDTHELLEKMNGVSHIIDINRENSCSGYTKRGLIDAAHSHYDKITDKDLGLDIINGCNHIAVFLRWCIEHDLHNKYFFERFPGIVEDVKEMRNTDLRKFLMDCTHGELNSRMFSYLGYMFTRRYYDYHNSFDDCFFPADVDSCAEDYFGTEKYNSEEFQDEAYLFVPFDEEYYRSLSAYISRAYDIFYPEYLEYNYNSRLPLIKAAEKALECECIFPKDQRDVCRELKKAFEESEKEGYYPLLLVLDDPDDISERTESPVEKLSRILRDCDEPFMFAVVIAKITGNILKNFNAEDPAVLRSDTIKEDGEALEGIFGIKPSVLEISESGIDLIMPQKNGEYLLFKGE